jgi:hypothetical protein
VIPSIPNRPSRGVSPRLSLSALLAACFLLLGATLVAPVSAQDDPPVLGPKLRVDSPSHDWGKLIKGESHEHVFIVRNVGSETLLIERIKST